MSPRLGAWTDEQIAQAFHETYERLAPDFGYKTREASAVPWEDVPDANKRLMIAVASEVRQAFAPALTSEEVSCLRLASIVGGPVGEHPLLQSARRKLCEFTSNPTTEIHRESQHADWSVRIDVRYVTDEIGGSGRPRKPGWWWFLQIGREREEAVADSEESAWSSVTRRLLERVS
jgi:hypothetical protein